MKELRYVQVVQCKSSDRFSVGDIIAGTESQLRLLLDGSNLWHSSSDTFDIVSLEVLLNSKGRVHFIESVDFSGFKFEVYTPKRFAKVLGI